MGVRSMNNIETRANSAAGKGGRQFPAWLVMVLLVLVTVALYWPATSHDFADYDDNFYVTENSHVQGGLTWAGAKWAFLNPVAGNWHPLTVLSHMLDCQLFGLNPWGHHLTSVLLHAVNTVLVFLLLLRLTGLRPEKGAGAADRQGGAFWRSVMVAVLFGWHPVHVESVAWVAERKDVLSTCFGLLTLIAYARYVEKSKVQSPKSKVWYGLALLLFALGLMSKAMLVTWPFVLLLLDWWPLQRVSSFKFSVSSSGTVSPSTLNPLARRSGVETAQLSTLVFEKLPFFVLAAVMSVVTFAVQQHSGAMQAVESLPVEARAENALISYCRYLGKLFWPVDLAVFYPYSRHWPMGEVLLAGVMLLSITVLCIVVRRRYPFMLMGWLWYVGTLVPVIGLVQVGDQALADRYTYIPSIGVLVLVIWGAYELTRRWRNRVMIWSVAGCGAIILCVGLTRQQLGYWTNDETLFRHAVEVTKNNYLAHNNLGDILSKNGRTDEAISQFQEAIRQKADYADAHYNLGRVFSRKGQLDQAVSQYRAAIRLNPDFAKAHNNLGNALFKEGRLDEAIEQLQAAIRLDPNYAEAHGNLGNVFFKRGQLAEAISQFQEAIRLKPDEVNAHYNLGAVLSQQGRTDEAINQFQAAIRLRPEYAEAYDNLAKLLAGEGRLDEAVSCYRAEIGLKPGAVDAEGNLGNVLAAQGRHAEADREYEAVLRLVPNSAQGHLRYGQALAAEHRYGAAKGEYEKVLELHPGHREASERLAWLLATCPEASLRDGKEAVELAEGVRAPGGNESPQFLDTLGAAYAEAGEFEKAVETARRALELPATKEDPSLAAGIQSRLKLYEAHTAYHEGP